MVRFGRARPCRARRPPLGSPADTPPLRDQGRQRDSCLLSSVLGTVQISPHIVRPGKVITARIVSFSCIDLPLTGPCPVKWNRTGINAITGSVASYLTPITRCGKLDHTCEWRVSKRAPTTRYDVLGVNISRTVAQATGGEFSADINDFVGILGPKPPPPLPKPSQPVEGPPPFVPPPVIPVHPPG